MTGFSFSIPQNLIFGSGSLERLPELVQMLGVKKAFFISGPHLNRMGLVDQCRTALAAAGLDSAAFTETEGNPSTETVERAAAAYTASGAGCIVALGGGSPLDVAKAVAVLVTYGGRVTDYEGGGKVPGPVTPMIAVPTTAGTGSEATAFAVITDRSRSYKLTIASPHLLPQYAILDPALIATVPAGTAAACGIDALVHALEAYLSLASSPVSDLFAREALLRIGRSLRAYVANPANQTAAEDMLLGSLLAGIAFSHARLGNVHAMSHPVSARFGVAHGMANAILLPTVVAFNSLADAGKYYEIYRCVAKAPVEKERFTAAMLVHVLQELNAELGIPADLRAVGVTDDAFEDMAEDAMKSGNILVNPRRTTKEQIVELYGQAFFGRT